MRPMRLVLRLITTLALCLLLFGCTDAKAATQTTGGGNSSVTNTPVTQNTVVIGKPTVTVKVTASPTQPPAPPLTKLSTQPSTTTTTASTTAATTIVVATPAETTTLSDSTRTTTKPPPPIHDNEPDSGDNYEPPSDSHDNKADGANDDSKTNEEGTDLTWLWILLGIAIGGGAIGVGIFLWIRWLRKKKRKQEEKKTNKTQASSSEPRGQTPNASSVPKKTGPPKNMPAGTIDPAHFKFLGPLTVDSGVKGDVRHALEGEVSHSLKEVVFDDQQNMVYHIGSNVELLEPSTKGKTTVTAVDEENTFAQGTPNKTKTYEGSIDETTAKTPGVKRNKTMSERVEKSGDKKLKKSATSQKN